MATIVDIALSRLLLGGFCLLLSLHFCGLIFVLCASGVAELLLSVASGDTLSCLHFFCLFLSKDTRMIALVFKLVLVAIEADRRNHLDRVISVNFDFVQVEIIHALRHEAKSAHVAISLLFRFIGAVAAE